MTSYIIGYLILSMGDLNLSGESNIFGRLGLDFL